MEKQSIWKRLKRKVKNKDMYGHNPELNIFDKGPTYNSFLGGVVSLGVSLLVLLYISTLLYKLFMNTDNHYESIAMQ